MTFAEIEQLREEQGWRELFIRLGDQFADLAWLFVHKTRGRSRFRKACGLLVKACDMYQRGGLSRRARSCWRYAQLLHRAEERNA
jgi:hypothetical protein